MSVPEKSSSKRARATSSAATTAQKLTEEQEQEDEDGVGDAKEEEEEEEEDGDGDGNAEEEEEEEEEEEDQGGRFAKKTKTGTAPAEPTKSKVSTIEQLSQGVFKKVQTLANTSTIQRPTHALAVIGLHGDQLKACCTPMLQTLASSPFLAWGMAASMSNPDAIRCITAQDAVQ